MNRILKSLLLSVLIIFWGGGCRKPVPYHGPEMNKPMVDILSKYQPGSDVQALIEDLNLTAAEVRYHSGLTKGRSSAVYFMEDGNLHVDTQEAGDGARTLLSVPYFEQAEGSAEARVAKWDGALETGPYPGKKK